MIFFKGELGSVTRVIEALTHFSKACGLIANMEKSSIFMAGVDDHTKELLLAKTGLSLGSFPFKTVWTHKAPQDCSWYQKNINSLKEDMNVWYEHRSYNPTPGVKYSITRIYNTIIGTQREIEISELNWSAECSNIMDGGSGLAGYQGETTQLTNSCGRYEMLLM
ncbi:hypothetical protein MTR67_033705 [Solanum verrucosum]|uniref:Uncharacterized protein n=1 Tax=Solanum verrucosum TaxID=315347 RepID=A0AAF0U6S9_SOLVR|nr:hypothetical protein MTR67_033705 [Solanum verrucosum]